MKQLDPITAMLDPARRFLFPPLYPDDEDKNRLAYRLTAMSLIGILITLIYTGAFIFLVQDQLARLIFGVPILIAFVMVMLLVRANRIKFASYFFLSSIWCITTFIVTTAGGTRAPFFGFYAVIVLSAVVLSGWNSALILGLLTFFTGSVLTFLAEQGQIPDPPATPVSAWLTQTAIMVFITLLGSIVLQDIKRSLQQAQEALSERKKSDEALRESEKRYRIISEMISDYAFASDLYPDSSFTPVWITDESFERLTGYQWDEIGASYKLYHPEDAPKVTHDVTQTLAGHPTSGEYRIITKSGEIRWLYVHRVLEWDKEKTRPIRMYGSAQDITERKNAQNAVLALNTELENKAAQLTALNEIARDISSLTGLTNTLNLVLTKLQTILPLDVFYVALYDADTQYITFPLMYDSGRFWNQDPVPLNTISRFARVLHTGQPILVNRTQEDIETHVRLGNVDQASTSIMMAPLPLGDKNIGVISIQSYTPNQYQERQIELLLGAAYQIAIAIENARLYDSLQNELTERKRLEAELQGYANTLEKLVEERTDALRHAKEQFELILNNTTNALAFADPDGNVLVTNPAFRSTFSEDGSQSIEFILQSLTSDEQMILVGDALLKVIHDKESQRIEVRIVSKAGQEKDVDLTFIPVSVSESEARNGVLLSGHDITQLKEIERFKARFVADAVHDLATPIAGLSSRMYLLKRNPERLADHVRALENQVQHLRNLLDDLRTLSQMDRGQMALNITTCNVNTLAQRVFDLYEPVALDKQQVLKLAIDPALPDAQIDPRLIERVLVNLVSNAINYTPVQKEVSIETSVKDQMIVIRVTDQGIGIKAEDLTHIFERFYRTPEARENISSGTGLGLAITKEIIDMHGGSITVTSEIGKGSTFTVYLKT